METVVIKGLGLIGGSIALSLKGRYLIAGEDTDKKTMEFCCRNNIIDEPASAGSYKKAAAVFVATPFASTKNDCIEALKKAGPNTVVTDVASVKGQLKDLGPNFVGGHPMAGVEKSGILAAKGHMFENAYYIIVKYTETSGFAVERLTALCLEMGAIPKYLSPEEHDAQVAKFSHLPHAAAYSLVNAVSGASGTDDEIAGSGFYDTTRIAMSSPQFWTDVFKTNRENILNETDRYIENISYLKEMLLKEDYSAIELYLSQAKAKREKINYKKKSDYENFIDVDVKDKSGELYKITGLLYKADANISNIEVRNSRDGAGGALRLYFKEEKDYMRAKAALGVK